MCAALTNRVIVEPEIEFSIHGGMAYAHVAQASYYARKRYGLDNAWLALRSVHVDRTARGRGYGNAILTKVTDYCDVHHFSLCLTVRPYDKCPLTFDQLQIFYRRHGFYSVGGEGRVMLRYANFRSKA